MANELDQIDLDALDIERVKELKNEAIERLKAAGDAPLLQTGHQSGLHTSHVDHTVHNDAFNESP